jgi:hypothetical protein
MKVFSCLLALVLMCVLGGVAQAGGRPAIVVGRRAAVVVARPAVVGFRAPIVVARPAIVFRQRIGIGYTAPLNLGVGYSYGNVGQFRARIGTGYNYGVDPFAAQAAAQALYQQQLRQQLDGGYCP